MCFFRSDSQASQLNSVSFLQQDNVHINSLSWTVWLWPSTVVRMGKVSCVVLSDCLGISEMSPDVHLAEATNIFYKCVYSLHACVPVLIGTAYQESECSI